MGLFALKAGTAELRIQRQIEETVSRISAIDREKKRIVDIYASGDLPHEAYVKKNLAYDAESVELRMQAAQLHGRIALLGDERSPKKMALDKRSFAGATIDLSAPTLTLRTGGDGVAWKGVKYIVSRSCRA
jgi:hypothetical protein